MCTYQADQNSKVSHLATILTLIYAAKLPAHQLLDSEDFFCLLLNYDSMNSNFSRFSWDVRMAAMNSPHSDLALVSLSVYLDKAKFKNKLEPNMSFH